MTREEIVEEMYAASRNVGIEFPGLMAFPYEQLRKREEFGSEEDYFYYIARKAANIIAAYGRAKTHLAMAFCEVLLFDFGARLVSNRMHSEPGHLATIVYLRRVPRQSLWSAIFIRKRRWQNLAHRDYLMKIALLGFFFGRRSDLTLSDQFQEAMISTRNYHGFSLFEAWRQFDSEEQWGRALKEFADIFTPAPPNESSSD